VYGNYTLHSDIKTVTVMATDHHADPWSNSYADWLLQCTCFKHRHCQQGVKACAERNWLLDCIL